MPQGKGTYGSKVGRPPKKRTTTANRSPSRTPPRTPSPPRPPSNPPRPSPLTPAERRERANRARRGTQSTTRRGSRTRRP